SSGQLGVDVNWISPGYYGNVDILFSSNNGASWTTLDSNIYNSGYLNVDFPSVVSNQCLLKIEATGNPSMFDVSNSTFTLTNTPPTINILYPTGGELFTIGQIININWIASNNISTVDIYFSDYEGDYLIASNVPAQQNIYAWQIPNGYDTNNQWIIKIQPHNSYWFQTISNAFNIQLPYPSISVTQPALYYNFYIGNYHLITWNSSQVQSFNIQYSPDFGTNWYPIANNVSGNSYYWYVNTPVVPNAVIKVSNANDTSIYSISEFFSIYTPSSYASLDISYSGPTNICAGDTLSITIDNVSGLTPYNNFTAQLSDVNGNFSNPTLIGVLNDYYSNTIVSCNIPDTISISGTYLIRVTSSENPGISDTISVNISTTPLFNFTANPLVNYLPTSGLINFTFNGNPSTITSYLWDFGDGGNATTQNPTHNYTSPGIYTISLTASNIFCTNTVTTPLYIAIEQLFDTDTIYTLTSQDILGLAFVNQANGCFALANGNCLITQDSGLTFTTVPVGLTTALTSASLVSGLWLVTSSGGNVAISTNAGNTWTVQNVGTTDSLFASAFLDNTNGYVVGNNGMIFKYNGSNWAQQTSGTTNSLRGIAFSDTVITTVGYNGTILRSSGNSTWGPITSPYNSHYRGVAF
ncbi:MAG: PKD domain-containing protein, partial [Bacteroidia bacterium]